MRKVCVCVGESDDLEIGCVLSTFGLLFMLLVLSRDFTTSDIKGVILFFDGALLAIGNVSLLFELC